MRGGLRGPCQAVPQLLPGRNVGRCPGLLLFSKEVRKSRFFCDFAPFKNLDNPLFTFFLKHCSAKINTQLYVACLQAGHQVKSSQILYQVQTRRSKRERCCEFRWMGQAERASWRRMTRDGLEGWVRLRGIQG